MSTQIEPFSAMVPAERKQLPTLAEQQIERRGFIPLDLVVAMIVVSLIALLLLSHVFRTVKAGEVAVVYNHFGSGTSLDAVYREGTHFVPPWEDVTVYDARPQALESTVSANASDGSLVKVSYVVRFKPVEAQLGKLHQTVGTDYPSKVVLPMSQSALREAIGSATVANLAPSHIPAIQSSTLQQLKDKQSTHHVEFLDLTISNLQTANSGTDLGTTDPILSNADPSLSAAFRAAEQLRIEAQGIADFERISGISVLQWRRLQLLEKLAQAPEGKILVLGSDFSPTRLIPGSNP